MNDIFLAVNPNGDFVIFNEKPIRYKIEIMIDDPDHWREDYQGNIWYGKKGTGKYEERWGVRIYNSFIKTESYGSIIDPKYLCEDLKKLTWMDNPMKLNK